MHVFVNREKFVGWIWTDENGWTEMGRKNETFAVGGNYKKKKKKGKKKKKKKKKKVALCWLFKSDNPTVENREVPGLKRKFVITYARVCVGIRARMALFFFPFFFFSFFPVTNVAIKLLKRSNCCAKKKERLFEFRAKIYRTFITYISDIRSTGWSFVFSW